MLLFLRIYCYEVIHLYILEKFYIEFFFHKFKNVIKKSVYWIYIYHIAYMLIYILF